MMTNRQMVSSAEQTLEMAEAHGMDIMIPLRMTIFPDESVMFDHLEGMVGKMRAGVDTWPEAKMGRWLGWIQASVTAVCSPQCPDTKWLDAMKSINVGNSAG